jgi:dCMP deaminase
MRNTTRPNWDDYFIQAAELVKTRSTCLRRKVGAVLVKDKRILATGYNGAPSGLPHCKETGCLREQLNVPSGERHELCRGLHAEQNVILQAALHGVSVKGSKLYVTCVPCSICAKMIINAGIKGVVYNNSYPDRISSDFFKKSGVKLRKYNRARKRTLRK